MGMTLLTTLAVVARSDENPTLAPMPWRRMAWVTWRQHRTALTGVAVLLGAIAVGLWVAGLHLHHAYSAAIACHPASSFTCNLTCTKRPTSTEFNLRGASTRRWRGTALTFSC